MRVMCVFDFEINPNFEGNEANVEYGEVYTVKDTHSGYCDHLKQVVDAYEFYEIPNYYDVRIFIPISDIDELELIKNDETLIKKI